MVSDTNLTIGVKNKSAKGTITIDSSSVILPINNDESGTYGVVAATMFDKSIKRMKYHNGDEWITVFKGSDLTDPINNEISNIKNVLNTKVDTVISGVSSVPMASISGTTLYINFPVSGGGGTLPEDQTGLFTSAPEGAIQGYSLLSGQTHENARDTLGDQTSSDGTADNPYVTRNGWCIADGKYWKWEGENGTVIRQVPNLNDQSPYLAGTPYNAKTVTDRVIAASGSIEGHALTIAEMPRHKHGIRLMHGWDDNKQDAEGYPNTNWMFDPTPAYSAIHNASQPDYSWCTPNGGGNPLGSIGDSLPHSHGLTDVQPKHCNIIWMYNIAIPQAALTINKGDGRYVRKTGDNMTGSLGIQGTVTPTDYSNFDSRYLKRVGDDTMQGSLTLNGRVTPSDYGNFDERYMSKNGGAGFCTTFYCPRVTVGNLFIIDKTFTSPTTSQYLILELDSSTTSTNKLQIWKNGVLISTLTLIFGSNRHLTQILTLGLVAGDTIRIVDVTPGAYEVITQCYVMLAN